MNTKPNAATPTAYEASSPGTETTTKVDPGRVPPWFTPYKDAAPGLAAAVEQAFAAVYEPSALELKYKLLVAMAIDAVDNVPEGVTTLSQLARDAGATDAEIVDAIKVAFLVPGAQVLAAGLGGLSNHAQA